MNSTRRDGVGTCGQGHRFEYMVVHSGFNDSAYAYCDHCGMTAFVGSYGDDKAPAVHL